MSQKANPFSELNLVKKQLDEEPFTADLNLYLNIEEESRLILLVAKEVEFQRDKIIDSVNKMKSSNEIKLNK